MQISQIRALQRGATEREVVSQLGQPENSRQIGTLTGYKYENGFVYFRGGHFSHAVTSEDHLTQIVVEVEGLAAEEPKKKTALIVPMKKEINIDDIEFRQFSALVRKALETKGYEFIEPNKKPQVIILMSYGVSDPQHRTETHTVPVYDYVVNNTPKQSTTTQNVYGAYGQNLGKVESQTTYGDPYAVNMPQQVYRGEQTVTKNWTEHVRFLVVEAYDNLKFLKGKKMVQFWKYSATSTGRSGDMRAVMPAMVTASKDFIGSDTGIKHTIRIWDNDPALTEFTPGARALASPERR